MGLSEREQEVFDRIVRNPLISQQELATELGLTRSSVAGYVMRLTEKGLIRGRGYVLNDAPYVVVVGGANVDVEGQSAAPIVSGDSCPGRVRRSPGGVGRNIAHRLASHGVDTRLVTAFGHDANGQWLHQQTAEAGVDLGDSFWTDRPTATYLAVLDVDGELSVAINDMAIVESLDAATMVARASLLANADLVIADGNLLPPALEALGAYARTLFVDPVSAAKAPRLEPVLDRIHTLKPNRAELEALTGVSTRRATGLRRACAVLLERGVQRVVVSLGAEGALLAEGNTSELIAAPSADGAIVSVTGAGDAMTAGLAAAHLQGLESRAAVEFAMTCAASALANPGATTTMRTSTAPTSAAPTSAAPTSAAPTSAAPT